MTLVFVINNYGQFAHLIHRALRDLDVECELVKNTFEKDELLKAAPDGLVLSGGPSMDRIGNCKEYVKEVQLPILGICLGHQLIAETFGGAVRKGTSGGYARVTVEIIEPDDILVNMKPTIVTWASHADEVSRLPNDFMKLARSAICEVEAMKHLSEPIYGVQWHPEVAHTEAGNTLLLNFVKICEGR